MGHKDNVPVVQASSHDWYTGSVSNLLQKIEALLHGDVVAMVMLLHAGERQAPTVGRAKRSVKMHFNVPMVNWTWALGQLLAFVASSRRTSVYFTTLWMV